MSQRSRFSLSTLAVTGASLLLLAPFARADEASPPGPHLMPAWAGRLALTAEPGVAFPLTEPQSQLFDTGGGGTLKVLWSLSRHMRVGPSATFILLPSELSGDESGRAWAFGGSLRLQRPHASAEVGALRAISPWVDADALYVRTGGLDRAGFAAAAGLAIPIGAARAFWVGPFVRYFQILQFERTGFDNRDAKILSVGISLEVGSGVRRACSDRDGDGVGDGQDRCPDVAGPSESWGCPPYEKVVVKPDMLELKEKLYFAWDQAVIEEASFPVLDEVAQALKDNAGFRVQVEGHASSEGGDEHNQTLSERRAEAVLDYLVARGIAKERLVSKGFSSSVPAASNVTEAGREQNRRVEFVVHFIILDDRSK